MSKYNEESSFLSRLYKERTGYLFILPQFILFFGLMIYPIISGFHMSLYKITLKKETFIGIDNYVRLFQDESFIKAIMNTILFVVTVDTLSIVFGIIVSAAIFNKSNKYVSFIRGCFYIPVAVSMVVMTVTWTFLFSPSQGLINFIIGSFGGDPVNFLGDENLVMPIIIFVTFVSNIGQVIVLYVAAMLGIPNELFESAELDGASKIKQFTHIIIPLIKQTSMFVFINQTISVVKIFVVIQLLTNGGPNHESVTLMYYLYEKAFRMNNQMGEAAAIGVIMFLVCLGISLVQLLMFREKSNKKILNITSTKRIPSREEKV